MPFKSEKQRRYLFANHPKIARKWTKKYGSGWEKRRALKLHLQVYKNICK